MTEKINMNIAVLSQGLLSRIVETFRSSYVYSKHEICTM